MTFDDFLLHVFCLIDSEVEAMESAMPRLRSRGPRPVLHDSEVITIELVGEFLGLDQSVRLALAAGGARAPL